MIRRRGRERRRRETPADQSQQCHRFLLSLPLSPFRPPFLPLPFFFHPFHPLFTTLPYSFHPFILPFSLPIFFHLFHPPFTTLPFSFHPFILPSHSSHFLPFLSFSLYNSSLFLVSLLPPFLTIPLSIHPPSQHSP